MFVFTYDLEDIILALTVVFLLIVCIICAIRVWLHKLKARIGAARRSKRNNDNPSDDTSRRS